MENKIRKQFIYTLSDPETGIIKYVGKSNNPEKRLKKHLSDYELIESWTPKNKWIIYLKKKGLIPLLEIIDEGTDENINDLEKYWIKKFKSKDIKLKNATNGGDGYDWTGKKHKQENIMKMKMNHPFRKTILQFDLENNFICKYDSSHEVEEKINCKRSHVIRCCKGQKYYITVKGFYFRFIDNYFPCEKSTIEPDLEKINLIISEIKINEIKYLTKKEELSLKRKKSVRKNSKIIIEYDLNGNKLEEFTSSTDVTNKTGCHAYLISMCCKKKTHYSIRDKIRKIKVTFRYKDDPFDYIPFNKHIQKNSKRICKYDIDGNLIKIYESSREIENYENNSHGNILRCCELKYKKNGNFIVVKGFTWRFYKETKGQKIYKINEK